MWELFIPCFLIVLALNFGSFIFAWSLQTDKFTDITYSLSFIAVALYLIWTALPFPTLKWWIPILIIIWALRLGGYLFMRIHKIGVDKRFDEMRPGFFSFMKFWILQTISILIIALPMIFMVKGSSMEMSWLVYLGGFISTVGILTETVADIQKSRYKADRNNQDTLIKSGLYRIVRFPNYSGEILFWVGIFICALNWLHGWAYLALLSPVWIITLLTSISGIPLVIDGHEKKYGDKKAYKDYVQNTAKLIPGLY